MRPEASFTKAPAERRSAKAVGKSASLHRFGSSASLPLPVYRDFVDMLYSMRLPVLGLGAVFVCVCILAAFELGEPVYAAVALLGATTTILRIVSIDSYASASLVLDAESLRQWERRYATGNYVSAGLLALLNVLVLSAHDPLLHLITVSLVFSFGAGIVSRTSVRPKICVISLLLATMPTVGALALHAFDTHSGALHMEMFLIEAVLVAMITGLSLQTVAYLYRSAAEHHTARHDLAMLAKYDALTGLANRLLLRERFQSSIAEARRTGYLLAVHFLDLDGFKAINDRYGHPTGDALLEQVAHRLESIIRSGDTVARLGGDEFVMLQGGILHDDEAKMLAHRIIRKLSVPYAIDGNTMRVSVSVGIATAPQQGIELERLLACADSALYRAKAGGKARAMFCTHDEATTMYLAA